MTYPWLADAERRLARNAEGGRRAHALLVSGPRGLGKVDLALREAAALLCLSGERPACGRCRSCQLMAGGAHPDFRRVTFELNKQGKLRTEIVVDQIRDLIASLQLTHSLSALKVGVIHPAETMNRNAANALLKTLEEPAGDLVLMLVSSDDARLPATVRSRCQVVGVRQPDAGDARRWLMAEHRVDEEAAQVALEAGAGSPLLAAGLLQSGAVDGYRSARALLPRLEGDPDAVSEAFSSLSGIEPADCWSWLSLAAAARIRTATADSTTSRRHAAGMLRLQSLADRNHRLAATPVRHDLLLRDWLLEWSALPRQA